MAQTKNLKEALEHDLATMAKARDELRLQLKLAKADARDDWRRLEDTWQRVEEEIKRIGDHSKEPVKDMGAAARSLIGELKHGYARVKAQLEQAMSQSR